MSRVWKALTAVVAFAVVAGVSGSAYGFWRAPGSGSGVAAVGTMSKVTIEATTATDAGSSKLYPGGTANVVLKVNNPNTFAVHVVSIALTGTITANSGTCSTTGVTYTAPTSVPDIAPGASTVTLSNAASMSTSSDAGCQGATFDFQVTLTVKS